MCWIIQKIYKFFISWKLMNFRHSLNHLNNTILFAHDNNTLWILLWLNINIITTINNKWITYFNFNFILLIIIFPNKLSFRYILIYTCIHIYSTFKSCVLYLNSTFWIWIKCVFKWLIFFYIKVIWSI